eukprot:GILJ01004385.1.p1 GENE.GILJ01004385.1~~GILJ01004385.1.p1  ORF type:complete len:465 (+),score=105.12 GILJ01004385.1:53-1447(+)
MDDPYKMEMELVPPVGTPGIAPLHLKPLTMPSAASVEAEKKKLADEISDLKRKLGHGDGERKRKDPNRPRGMKTPFNFFSEEKRPALQAENPDANNRTISKMLGELWKNEQDKTRYEIRASHDKERYITEMAAYVPTPETEEEAMRRKRKRKKRQKKDPDAPRRGLSAYLHYSNAIRPDMQKEFPDKSVTDLAKIIAERWKHLTDQDREQYAKQAMEDADRYQRERDKYLLSRAEYDVEGGSDSMSIRKQRKKKDPRAPKKAFSAYLYFTQEVRPVILAEHGDVKTPELSKMLSDRWKSLPDEERDRYQKLATADADRYRREKAEYVERMAHDNEKMREEKARLQAQLLSNEKRQRRIRDTSVEIENRRLFDEVEMLRKQCDELTKQLSRYQSLYGLLKPDESDKGYVDHHMDHGMDHPSIHSHNVDMHESAVEEGEEEEEDEDEDADVDEEDPAAHVGHYTHA